MRFTTGESCQCSSEDSRCLRCVYVYLSRHSLIPVSPHDMSLLTCICTTVSGGLNLDVQLRLMSLPSELLSEVVVQAAGAGDIKTIQTFLLTSPDKVSGSNTLEYIIDLLVVL